MKKVALVIKDEIIRSTLAEQLRPQYSIADFGALAEVVSAKPDAIIADKDAVCGHDPGGLSAVLFVIGEAGTVVAEKASETFTFPLRLGHIMTRLQLHLAMQQQSPSLYMDIGPCKFYPRRKQIIKPDGGMAELTDKEAAVLSYLAQATEPVSREELLAAVWGYDGRMDTHTLETHIYRLRALPGMQSLPGWREFVLVRDGFYKLNQSWAAQ